MIPNPTPKTELQNHANKDNTGIYSKQIELANNTYF
jgi:hypothetical protein